MSARNLVETHLLVHTRLLRKFAVERYVRGKLAIFGVIAWGVLGALWWEALGAARSSQVQPGAARSSPEEPGELWNSSRRAKADPEHLENDAFGSERWGARFGLKPRPLSSEALKIHQIGSLTRKKHQNDLWSSCVA